MENHLKSHKRLKETYQCLIDESVFMSQSSWKVHRNSHQRTPRLFQCTMCSSSFETEQLRNGSKSTSICTTVVTVSNCIHVLNVRDVRAVFSKCPVASRPFRVTGFSSVMTS